MNEQQNGADIVNILITGVNNKIIQSLKTIPYDKTYRGKIIMITPNNNFASIEINKSIYTNIPKLRHIGSLSIGDIVTVREPQNQPALMFIDGVFNV